MKFGVLSQRGLSSRNLGVTILPAPSPSISPTPSPLPLSSQLSGLPSGSFPDTDPETASVKSSFNESPCVDIPLNAAPSNTSNISTPHSFPQKVAPNFPLISRRSVLQGGARCALGGMAGAIAGACGLRSEAWAAPAPSLGMTWSPVQFSGRDYLPLEQVGRFYGMGSVQRAGKECLLGTGEKTLRGAADSTDFFISRIKCVLSYPLAEVGASVCISRLDLVKLVEPVLRPFKIDGAQRVETIVLDAGHGGSDRGAVGRLGDEKTFTLDVAMRTGQLLSRAGYKVVFTRTSDEFVSLEERVQVANRLSRALFISVHFNSGGSGSGVETFALSPRGVPSMSNEGARVSDYGV
ncbi:MAG: N-acetylmuramoyl-L-alanine amidase [Proteobacteria bacterium]|nr:N-acetylmuramoyl-L-alanine amidase [Pseudomonadota bacterium]